MSDFKPSIVDRLQAGGHQNEAKAEGGKDLCPMSRVDPCLPRVNMNFIGAKIIYKFTII
jgi:hypothetical protein